MPPLVDALSAPMGTRMLCRSERSGEPFTTGSNASPLDGIGRTGSCEMGFSTTPLLGGVGDDSTRATVPASDAGVMCTLTVPHSCCSSSAMSFSELRVMRSPSLSSYLSRSHHIPQSTKKKSAGH
jgi:hypothetical protein